LAVAAFTDTDLQPGGGHRLAEPHGRIPWPQLRFVDDPRLSGQGEAILQFQAAAQRFQIGIRGCAFHLYQVPLPGPLARVGEAVGQPAVVGEQEQPFAVPVEPAGGVDPLQRNVVGQGGTSFPVGELG